PWRRDPGSQKRSRKRSSALEIRILGNGDTRCRGGLTPLKLNRRMLQPGSDPDRWIGSRGWQSLEIDLRNLLVEENALVGHTHRKCDREVRVNDSKVPRRGGDSGLTTGVNVVHAPQLRLASDRNTRAAANRLDTVSLDL